MEPGAGPVRGAVSFRYPALNYLTAKKIDFAASGDNTLQAHSGTTTIRCFKLFLVVGGATSLTFKNGSTALTGALPMLANGSLVLDIDAEPWFVTTGTNDLILNSSNAVQVSGALWFSQT